MVELTINTEDLFTMTDAAAFLGVTRPTLYNLVRRNRLHPVLIGRNRYLLKTELEALKGRNGKD